MPKLHFWPFLIRAFKNSLDSTRLVAQLRGASNAAKYFARKLLHLSEPQMRTVAGVLHHLCLTMFFFSPSGVAVAQIEICLCEGLAEGIRPPIVLTMNCLPWPTYWHTPNNKSVYTFGCGPQKVYTPRSAKY